MSSLSSRRRTEPRGVVLRDDLRLRQQLSVRGKLTGNEIVVETEDRIVSLRIRILADARVDHALVDIVQRLLDGVEGDEMHRAGFLRLIDGPCRAERRAGDRDDAAKVRMRR